MSNVESDIQQYKGDVKARDNPISNALVEAYINYREFEKKSSVHSDFHGPRDFYTMCKWINHNLKTLEDVYNKENFNRATWIIRLTSYFLLAIERNFSGREIIKNRLGKLIKIVV